MAAGLNPDVIRHIAAFARKQDIVSLSATDKAFYQDLVEEREEALLRSFLWNKLLPVNKPHTKYWLSDGKRFWEKGTRYAVRDEHDMITYCSTWESHEFDYATRSMREGPYERIWAYGTIFPDGQAKFAIYFGSDYDATPESAFRDVMDTLWEHLDGRLPNVPLSCLKHKVQSPLDTYFVHKNDFEGCEYHVHYEEIDYDNWDGTSEPTPWMRWEDYFWNLFDEHATHGYMFHIQNIADVFDNSPLFPGVSSTYVPVYEEIMCVDSFN